MSAKIGYLSMWGLLASVACSTTPSAPIPVGMDARSPLVSCDPLVTADQPITLGTVVAAGSDESGTLFVAALPQSDRSEARVFVSRDGELYRKRVEGSGQRDASDFQWSFEDGAVVQRLVAKRAGNRTSGIALAPSGARSFFDELGAEAQLLEPVDDAVPQKLVVHNLPAEVVVEYVGTVEDGSQIVVTRPRDDFAYEDFRVFYGVGDVLAERATTNVGRGSTTWIDFMVDDVEYSSVFTSSLAPSVESHVDVAGATLSITTVEPPVVPAELMFECLQ